MNASDARTAFAQAVAWIQEGRGVAFEFDEPPYGFTVIPIEGARWDVGNSFGTYRATLIRIGTCDGPRGPRFRIYSSKGPAGAEEPIDGHILSGERLVSVRPVRDEPIEAMPRVEIVPESLEAVWTAMRELEYRISVALDDDGLSLSSEQRRTLRRIMSTMSEFSWDGVGGAVLREVRQ